MEECSAQARSMVYSLVHEEISMLGIQEQPCELWLQPTKNIQVTQLFIHNSNSSEMKGKNETKEAIPFKFVS